MMLLALATLVSGFLLLALIELAWPHANLIFGAAVAEGKVVSSGMESNGHGDRRRFRPQITYEFGKENCVWRNTIPLGWFTKDEDKAQSLLAAYPVGSQVRIRFDSWRPSVSTWILSRTAGIEWFALIARLLFVFGAFLTIRHLMLG